MKPCCGAARGSEEVRVCGQAPWYAVMFPWLGGAVTAAKSHESRGSLQSFRDSSRQTSEASSPEQKDVSPSASTAASTKGSSPEEQLKSPEPDRPRRELSEISWYGGETTRSFSDVDAFAGVFNTSNTAWAGGSREPSREATVDEKVSRLRNRSPAKLISLSKQILKARPVSRAAENEAALGPGRVRVRPSRDIFERLAQEFGSIDASAIEYDEERKTTLVGCEDGRLFALRLDQPNEVALDPLWEARVPSSPVRQIFVFPERLSSTSPSRRNFEKLGLLSGGKTLVVVLTPSTLCCLDLLSGQFVWSPAEIKFDSEVVAIAPVFQADGCRTVWVQTKAGTVTSYFAEDGRPAHTRSTGLCQWIPPVGNSKKIMQTAFFYMRAKKLFLVGLLAASAQPSQTEDFFALLDRDGKQVASLSLPGEASAKRGGQLALYMPSESSGQPELILIAWSPGPGVYAVVFRQSQMQLMPAWELLDIWGAGHDDSVARLLQVPGRLAVAAGRRLVQCINCSSGSLQWEAPWKSEIGDIVDMLHIPQGWCEEHNWSTAGDGMLAVGCAQGVALLQPSSGRVLAELLLEGSVGKLIFIPSVGLRGLLVKLTTAQGVQTMEEPLHTREAVQVAAEAAEAAATARARRLAATEEREDKD